MNIELPRWSADVTVSLEGSWDFGHANVVIKARYQDLYVAQHVPAPYLIAEAMRVCLDKLAREIGRKAVYA